MARRGVKYEPTDTMRNQVLSLAGFGVPHDRIATVMEVNKTTLYRHYRAELALGLARADAQLARSVFDQAVGRPAEFNDKGKRVREEMKPDRSVAIFLSKVRLGYKDTQYVGISLEDLDLSRLNSKEVETLASLVRKANKTAANPGEPGTGG